jgi:hypothetical protein
LLIPVPLKISSPPGAGHPGQYGEMLKVKESELEVNPILFTSTELEMLTSLREEGPNVAISEGPFGGPPADQLLRFSQAESCGDNSQLALPAMLI